MEFGTKMRVPNNVDEKDGPGLNYLYTVMVHQIIDEMPTEIIKKMFKIEITDPDDTKTAFKLMNPKTPEHERINLQQLRDTDQIGVKVSIKLSTK